MKETTPPGCPDLEMIAAFLDGRLKEDERSRVEAHLAECESCYEIFSETARYNVSRQGAAVLTHPSAFARFGRVLAVAAALVLVAGGIFYWRRSHTVNARPDVAELVAAMKGRRLFEARITGGFDYAPLEPTYRAASTDESHNWQILGAAGKVESRTRDSEKPRDEGDLGIAYLLAGKYDEAVSKLEDAVRDAPKDAGLLTDLSAAYLARAEKTGAAVDYPRALDAAARAIEVSPNSAEGLFNRALALDAIGLKNRATAAWRDYLSVDASSRWAIEAKRRLEELSNAKPNAMLRPGDYDGAATVIRRASVEDLRALHATRGRELHLAAESILLGHWADLQVTGKLHEAEEELAAADKIAGIEAGIFGDKFLADVVAAARSARPADRDFVEGTSSLGRGIQTYLRGEVTRAVPDIRMAHDKLTRSCPALWLDAEMYDGIENFYSGKNDDLPERFGAIEKQAAAAGYEDIAGRAAWMQALLADYKDELVAGLNDFTHAREALSNAQETGYLAPIDSQIATQYEELGDPDRAWEAWKPSVAEMSDTTPDKRTEPLAILARYLVSDGMGRAGLAAAEEAVSASAETSPGYHCDALNARTEALLSTGRTDDAKQSSDASRLWASQVSDPALRSRLDPLIDLEEGRVLLDRQPELAATLLRRAADAFKARGQNISEAELDLALGRAALAAGRPAEAMKVFRAGIDESESKRVDQGQFTISFFDTRASLYDEAIEELIREHAPPKESLALYERQKTRDLLNLRQHLLPFTADEFAREIPSATAVLYIDALPKQCAIWILAAGTIDMSVQETTRDSLALTVSQLRQALLSANENASRPIAERMFRTLIKPLGGRLAAIQNLVIVPDAVLSECPFGALYSTRENQFLGEKYPDLVIDPSGTAYLRASKARGRPMSSSGDNLLVVADPLPQRTPGAKFSPALPGARRLAESIGRDLPRAHILLGSNATRENVMAAARHADVIVFACHGFASRPGQGYSGLQLGGEPGNESGIVSAADLLSITYQGKTVVLASCSSAVGEYSRSEGALSLARAFLRAGARSVTAMLWDSIDREPVASSPIFLGRSAEASGRSPSEISHEWVVRLLGREPRPTSWSGRAAYFGIVQRLGAPA